MARDLATWLYEARSWARQTQVSFIIENFHFWTAVFSTECLVYPLLMIVKYGNQTECEKGKISNVIPSCVWPDLLQPNRPLDSIFL